MCGKWKQVKLIPSITEHDFYVYFYTIRKKSVKYSWILRFILRFNSKNRAFHDPILEKYTVNACILPTCPLKLSEQHNYGVHIDPIMSPECIDNP